MSIFDEYKKADNKMQFYTREMDKTVDADRDTFDYDAEQLMDHFELRTADKSDNAFAERTKFYFADTTMAKAKYLRYRNMSPNGDKSGVLDDYATTYSYHKASKRKKSALAAGNNYREMYNKIKAYKDDDDKGVDDYQKYIHRKEIMKLRQEAMINAAQVKSRNAKHENYLIARAKLSCNMILKDQLEHFIAKNGDNAVFSEVLGAELRDVNKEIGKAIKEVTKNVKSSQERWKESNDFSDRTLRNMLRLNNDKYGLTMDDMAVMAPLQDLSEQQRDIKWPKRMVLKDSNGAKISKADIENEKLNTRYDAAVLSNDRMKLDVFEKDALRRFEKFKVPTTASLCEDKTRTYILNNFMEYYDIFKRALPYYKQKIQDNAVIGGRNLRDDKKFCAKVTYLEAVDKYISFILMRDHRIDYKARDVDNTTGEFVFASNYSGLGDGSSQFEDLISAFQAYNRVMTEKDAIVEQKPINQLNNEKGNGNDEENNIEAGKKEAEVIRGLLISTSSNKNIVDDDEDEKKVEEKKVEEKKAEEKKAEEKKAEEKKAEEKKVEDKKEEKKQEQKISAAKSEQKKSAPKQEQKVNKAAKKDGTRTVKGDFVYIWENGKEYRYTKAEEKEYNKFKKIQPLVSRDAYAMYRGHDFVRMKLNKEYDAMFNNMGTTIRSSLKEGGESSIDRDLGAVMRTVHFDAKGKPLTAKDMENHKWNLKWFKCWEKGKENFAEADKMIDEELTHIYDDYEDLLDIFKENIDNEAELISKMEEYCDRKMKEDPEKFEKMRCLGGTVDNLRRKVPSVRYLVNHTRFGAISNVLDFFGAFVVEHIKYKYGLIISETGEKAVIKPNQKDQFAAVKFSRYAMAMTVIEQYKKNQDRIEKKEEIKFKTSKELDQFHILDKELIDQLKEKKPAPTAEGIEILKARKAVFSMKHNDEYIKLGKKAPEGLRKGATADTIDRVFATGMKPVEFDGNFNPINTPENLANHKSNIKWLKAWDSEKLDEKTINETLSEQLDNMLEGMTMPPIPKTAQGEPGYVEKLNEWIDDTLKTNPKALFGFTIKTLALDALSKYWAPVKEYNKKNQTFAKLADFSVALSSYLTYYLGIKHNINVDTTYNSQLVLSQQALDAYKPMVPLVAMDVTSALFALDQVDKTKDVKYSAIVNGEEEKEEEKPLENKINVEEEVKNEIIDEKKEDKNVINEEKNVINEEKVEEKQPELKNEIIDEQAKEVVEENKIIEEEKKEEKVEEKKEENKIIEEEKEEEKNVINEEKNFVDELEEKEPVIIKEVSITLPNFANFEKSRSLYAGTMKKKVKVKEKVRKGFRKVEREVEKEVTYTQQELVEKFKSNVNDATDRKISLRRAVDINDKKRLDFKTYEALSEFGSILGSEKELAKLCRLYGDGQKERKEGKKSGDTKCFEAINMMTKKIFDFDPDSFDLSTDETMTDNAFVLEQMSGAVEAYKNIILREENKGYLEALSKKKSKFEPGKTMADKLYDQLEKLSAIANYYRLRKLVVTDDFYTEEKEVASYATKPKDGTQLRRYKKMVRASLEAAKNLSKVMKGKQVLLGHKGESPFETENLSKLSFDHVKVDQAKIDKKKKVLDDKIKTLSKEKDSEAKAEAMEKLSAEYDEVEALKVKDLKDYTVLEKLGTLKAADDYIRSLKNESFFQAPRWLRNALTLDPKKIPKHLSGENAMLGINHSKADDILMKVTFENNKHANELNQKRKALKTEMLGENKAYSGIPKFKGGKNADLETLIISDDWTRIDFPFAVGYSYGLSDEEVLEMTELLTIQQSKEWTDKKNKKHSKNWEDIAKDPEAVEFYESAYTEQALKLIYANYATGKRSAETITMKMAVLHPTDLILQMTPQLHAEVLAGSTLSNLFDSQNGKKTTQLKKFIQENDKGRYNMDAQDINDTCGITTAQNFKFCEIGYAITGIGSKEYYSDEDIQEEYCEKLFKNSNFMHKKVYPEIEKYKNANPKAIIDGKLDGKYEAKGVYAVYWYLNRHPEMITKELLNTLDDNKKGVLQGAAQKGLIMFYSRGEQGYRNTILNKTVDIPSNKELDAYEAHLNKEGYYHVRDTVEGDPYFGVGEADPNEMVDVENVEFNEVGEIKKEVILENRKKDPYGINLIRNGLEELIWEKKPGEKILRCNNQI